MMEGVVLLKLVYGVAVNIGHGRAANIRGRSVRLKRHHGFLRHYLLRHALHNGRDQAGGLARPRWVRAISEVMGRRPVP